MNELNAHYFPTSVVMVDDEMGFMENFSLLLNDKLPVCKYSSPLEALEFINSVDVAKSYGRLTDNHSYQKVEPTVKLGVCSALDYLYDNEKYACTTVLLVDYAMPGMDGLEFCRNISNKNIKKILLTGQADENIAIAAFNEGIIDRFFLKDSEDVHSRVNQAIDELQYEFFAKVNNPLVQSLIVETYDFMRNERIADFVNGLVKAGKVTEYYLWSQPRGYLLSDINGKLSFLYVCSDADLESHYEEAEAEDAPDELLQILEAGTHVPWFNTEDGFYSEDCEQWKECLHVADKATDGNLTWHYGVGELPVIKRLELEKVSPYRRFIRKLDLKVIQGGKS